MDTTGPMETRDYAVHRLATLCLGLALAAFTWSTPLPAADEPLILDDRASGTLRASSGACWRLVTDQVMGGVSDGDLEPTTVEGRPCLRLTGDVSLLNNGGFVQASLDLDQAGPLDARAYTGIEVDVYGNGQGYNLHLRTADTRIVWQSYRASFQAAPGWHTLRLPFRQFEPYRIDRPLDLARLKRLGLVSIGREMRADLCVARLALYP
jgi:hypothetical protein